MPLDGNLPTPDLKTFATILRDRTCWPKGFKWDYSDCRTCAMGLAVQLYSLKLEDGVPHTYLSATSKAFSMDYDKADDIFLRLAGKLGDNEKSNLVRIYEIIEVRKRITPENVADAIDQYLLTCERNDHKMKELELCH